MIHTRHLIALFLVTFVGGALFSVLAKSGWDITAGVLFGVVWLVFYFISHVFLMAAQKGKYRNGRHHINEDRS